MEAAGVALAIPAIIELCLKCGKDLIARCRNYKHAERHIQEAILTIENIWLAMEVKMEILREAQEDLPEPYIRHMASIIIVLDSKVKLAISRVDGLIGKDNEATSTRSTIAENVRNLQRKPGAVLKGKYAAVAKHPLDEVIEDMENWQKKFDISFSLISLVKNASLDKSIPNMNQETQGSMVKQMRNMRIANKTGGDVGAHTLQRTVFIEPARITYLEDERIVYSESQLATYEKEDGTQRRVLLDNAPRNMKKKDVRDLAMKFANMDPSIVQLLACQGVIEAQPDANDNKGPSYQFVFEAYGEMTTPRTLRSVLLEPEQCGTLSERIRLAASLARSIIFLHESGFVHKNIRPETVILLNDESQRESFGEPFLIGFEEVRAEDADTLYKGDNVPHRDLYRHPQRQGLHLQEEYKFQHDIYSLGVCLLEIGLWTSFVTYSDETLLDEKDMNAVVNGEFADIKPYKLKGDLVERADKELPSRMGEIYTEVVRTCLTCLDKDSVVFGDLEAFKDQDGITIGVRYIEKVLQIIERIAV